MHRFYVPAQNLRGREVVVDGGGFNHIVRVLRLRPGDRFVAFTGVTEHIVEIQRLYRDRLIGEVISERRVSVESPIKVVLVQGLPKGDKMDLIIQKCTELGIAEIVPVLTERSVVRLNRSKAAARLERWRRIARETATQSGRSSIPAIAEIETLQAAMDRLVGDGLGLFPWEGERAKGLKQVLRENLNAQRVFFFIGPEGGFSPQEVEMAIAKGIRPVSLGPWILRTETAGLATLIMIQYELGQLGSISPRDSDPLQGEITGLRPLDE